MEFECIVINEDGQRVKSVVLAESAFAASGTLRKSGAKPIKVTEIKPKGKTIGYLQRLSLAKKNVSLKELVVFTRQLGTMLTAGVLLTECLNTISQDLDNEYFAGIIKEIVHRINAGDNFSKALEHYPSIFSSYYLAIIASGESVGKLGGTVGNLAVFLEDDQRMRRKFMAAIRYPSFLLIVISLIVSGIVLFLVPKFEHIFNGAGLQLPLLTRIVVGISNFSIHYFIFVILGLILMFWGGWRSMQVYRIRYFIDRILLRMPLIGVVINKAYVGRFCQTLSMLLTGGVGIIQAIAQSSKVVDNYFLKAIFDQIGRDVVAGSSLSEAMAIHQPIPRVLVKMTAVGEKAGMLGGMLKRVGTYYDEEVEIFLNNINSILEPAFIVIIGAVVLVVAIALYLPIFMMSSMPH